MTRTGMASQLNQHLPQPLLPCTRWRPNFWLKRGDFTLVSSGHGSVVARCQVTTRQRLGDVFMPMHWNDHFTSNAPSGQTDYCSRWPHLATTWIEVHACDGENLCQWQGSPSCWYRIRWMTPFCTVYKTRCQWTIFLAVSLPHRHRFTQRFGFAIDKYWVVTIFLRLPRIKLAVLAMMIMKSSQVHPFG